MSGRLSNERIKKIWRVWSNKNREKRWVSKAAYFAGTSIRTVYYYSKDFEKRSLNEILSGEISSFEQSIRQSAEGSKRYAGYLKRMTAAREKRQLKFEECLLRRKRRIYGKILTGILIEDCIQSIGWGGARSLAEDSGLAEKKISQYKHRQCMVNRSLQPKLLKALNIPYSHLDDIFVQLPENIKIRDIESYLRKVLPTIINGY